MKPAEVKAGQKVKTIANGSPRYGIVLFDGLLDGRIAVNMYVDSKCKKLVGPRAFLASDTEIVIGNI